MEKNFTETRAFLPDREEGPFIKIEPWQHEVKGKWLEDVQITVEKGDHSFQVVMPFIHCKYLAAGLERYLLGGPSDPAIVVVRDGKIEGPEPARKVIEA